MPHRILLCGDFDDAEMRPAAEAVARHAPLAEFRRISDLRAEMPAGQAPSNDEAAWTPDLVVVAQRRPEQYSRGDVRRLQARFPLAPCVCCYGVWCESDGRNSTLWPDAVRVSARLAAARIRRELGVLESRLSPLPLTASRDEIFEFDSPGDWDIAGHGAIVRVVSPDRELKRTIESLLQSGGFRPTFDPEFEHLTAVVWDADPWRDLLADEMRSFCRRNPRVRVVALLNFAHPQRVAAMREIGVSAVVPKLSPAEQLFAALKC